MGITKTENNQTEPRKSLIFDQEYYQAMLDDPAIPEDQKQELMELLWWIAISFVDMGLGIHPLQQDDKTLRENGKNMLRKLMSDTMSESGKNQPIPKIIQPEKEDI